MKYVSTRGGIKPVSFEAALMSGYAEDGGILLPESIPSLDQETIRAWAKLSYPDLVYEITSLFISEDEIPREVLKDILDRAFSRFSIPDVVKLAQLKGSLNILELFHGPTLAFKDLALSCVGQFLHYFLKKADKELTILVATSGDTGSAAIEAVRGVDNVDIVVLLPKDRCSRVQELQMTTVLEDNVHVYRVDGSSDDLDAPIKRCFMDPEFVGNHPISSINSINWCRIMVQIAHYFYAYLQVCPDADKEVEIVVPTGACGNVTSGLVAVEMGLRAKFVCAVTVNDIVARTITNGDFSVSADIIQSHASAMDIQMPYNMERIMYLLTKGDAQKVKNLMDEFEKNDKITLPPEILNKMQRVMSGYRVTDSEIEETMRECFKANQYLLCPHTATAARYHEKNPPTMPRVCIATASPAKFEEAVGSAGLTPQPTEGVKALADMKTRYIDVEKTDDWDKILREKVVSITERREKGKK